MDRSPREASLDGAVSDAASDAASDDASDDAKQLGGQQSELVLSIVDARSGGAVARSSTPGYVVALVDTALEAGRAIGDGADDALLVPFDDGWLAARLELAGRVMKRLEERRELDGHIHAIDRMLSVGALAAGVAHELNTPLAYVMSNVEYGMDLLKRGTSLTTDELRELHDALTEAYQGTERMRTIVRDLRTFSRGGDDTVTPVDVHRVLESAINMCFGEIRQRARLTKRFDPVPAVVANESRLAQLFLNLLLNAAQAIVPGLAEQHQITVATSTGARKTAVIEVSDTGSGIEPRHMERIFEPLFTTKSPGTGTGLGLAICRSIVEALGGTLAVESSVGRGTTFRIELPGVADAPVESVRPHSAPPTQRARVLTIDDDPLVGRALARLLLGHELVSTASAREALVLLQRREERFDLILCDMTMADASGKDVYDELKVHAPERISRLVFMTGGTLGAGTREFLERQGMPIIEKPFDSALLRKLVLDQLTRV
ncbi:MAG: response regulator [Myxococcales bacterium]|nr:response regulator [Myxococcales bacterium]